VMPASHAHSFRDAAAHEVVRPAERTTRLGREIAGAFSDLPLSPSSSVFVRVDEHNVSDAKG
jgi:hypothetical protein